MGLGFEVGPGIKIETIYNFWHYCQKFDKKSKFQLRLAIND